MASIDTQLWINGQFVKARRGETFTLLNPATESKVCDVEIAGAEDVDAAVKAASAAQKAWETGPSSFRAKCLQKLADLIEQHGDEIAKLDSLAMGRPIAGQSVDIRFGAEILRTEASLIGSLVGDSSVLEDGTLSMKWFQPFGVCGAIIV